MRREGGAPNSIRIWTPRSPHLRLGLSVHGPISRMKAPTPRGNVCPVRRLTRRHASQRFPAMGVNGEIAQMRKFARGKIHCQSFSHRTQIER